MFKNLLNKIAGDPYQKELARYRTITDSVNEAEARLKERLLIPEEGQTEITDALRLAFSQKTAELRQSYSEAVTPYAGTDGEKKAREEALMTLLPEAFAAVRVASQLTIGLRPYDVQIIGGVVLHEGKIAEMKTGEGKTLVATLPLYLNALTGRGVHLVTVNDYLARRDGGWMGPIFHLLGLSTSVIGKEHYSAIYDPDYVDPGGELEDERLVHWRPIPRRECYRADITYGTSLEFGFDYLRDHTVIEYSRTVQRGHPFAIVDEVDSVLIDSARTPLIISGPAAQASGTYARFAEIIEKARLRRNASDIEHGEEPDGDYVLDDRTQNISLTDRGIEKIENLLTEIDTSAGQSIYDPQYYELVHYLENALKAKYIFHRNKEYIVQDGQVILIDQTTGRPMPSRRYSEGLHQAIEAKEGVAVKREDVTIATVTVQNYFRMYGKLSGMTGTALTQAEEFDKVYGLDVIAIPTNVEYRAAKGDFEIRRDREDGAQLVTYWDVTRSPDRPLFFKRTDYPDEVYQSVKGKFSAVIDEIATLNAQGRPVLVGTGSVEASEELSRLLRQKGIAHEVLNARNHQREALIIAQAGRPGAITISTSMAGRGTDILLGGNPEGLASKLINDQCFSVEALTRVVTEVVKGDIVAAKKIVSAEPTMDDAVVDWVEKANNDLVKKAQVEDIMTQVAHDMRDDPAYASIGFDLLIQILQQMNLAAIDPKRMEKAQAIAEEANLPPSLIPELEFRLNQYRSLQGLLGQAGHVETLAQALMERHFNARSALVRAVLGNHLDEARVLISQIPGLTDNMIGDIQSLVEECNADRRAIWEMGGLHVIGTERHESRRIDDQLRGRAARQGDPGSSKFYLSLEDDLMIRFGGERTRGMMERLNIPEEMPISANILSNAIEQAQGRFESYNFEIRKNLVEYDEAVNRQREIVYEERMDILSGGEQDLDQMVRRFIEDTLKQVIHRYREEFEAWATSEIEPVITDHSNYETNVVNARGVLTRVRNLLPRLEEEQVSDLLAIDDIDDLTGALRELVLDGMDKGHHLRIMLAEIGRVVPLWPVMPALTPGSMEGWESFGDRSVQVLKSYATALPDRITTPILSTLKEALDLIQRSQLLMRDRGASAEEMKNALITEISRVLSEAFIAIQEHLETDELIAALLERVDSLLEIARLDPPEGRGESPERYVFSIGAEELNRYERALMLTMIDQEWRQYLVAIDDLRSGISLEAYGQRDPKVQFKRRAFEMFDELRQDVQEGIARRFFVDLPRRRQIIEAQARQEALLDQMAQQGYRVQKKVTQTKEGQTKVSQTLEKDIWSSVGRNDPCPCGSGKKFKDCHYRLVQNQTRTVNIEEVKSRQPGAKKTRRRK